jgi:hypothetical protein
MHTSSRLVLTAIAAVFAMVTSAAYAQDNMKTANGPLKSGREADEDGGIAATSGKRLHGPGREFDDNIVQPGKRFDKPGRDIEEGTYDWDKVLDKPRRALNEEPGKKKRSKTKPVEQ